MGWCAQDRRRRPLTGLELRGCWTERPAGLASSEATPARPPLTPDPAWDVPARGFVPVEEVIRATPAVALPFDVPLAAVDPPDAWDGRVSLFGDPER